MNIRYIQTNLSKLHDDNLIKFLYDILISDLNDVDQYDENTIYHLDDMIYMQDNNIHQVYQCIVEESSTSFVLEEWEHITNIYKGETDSVTNLKIREEVHVIDENTVNGVVSNLQFKYENSSFAIYHGKKRYAVNHDFTVVDNVIKFNKPLNVGDRIILEVKETIGLPDRLVLLSSNNNKYEVGVVGNDVFVFKSDHRTAKDEVYVKDISNGNSYRIFMIDEDILYELTDINVVNTEVKVMDAEGNEYIVKMIDDDLYITFGEDESKLILMSDNGKIYEVIVVGGRLFIRESSETYYKEEVFIKDSNSNNSYKIYLLGDKLYCESTDIAATETRIDISISDGVEYFMEMIDGKLSITDNL